MARGLAAVLAPADLTIVVNVGDDARIYGVLVAADLDTVTYTLAGIAGPRGWGIGGDTHVVMDHLTTIGVDTYFQLGDRDLAHCLARTAFLDDGGTLSGFTRDSTRRYGIACSVLPASDDPIRTKIVTAAGDLLDFQDYFVRRNQRDAVARVEYHGATTAVPAPGVLDAIVAADVIIIAPSNPPLSIWPMLAMPALQEAVAGHPRVVAVSPLIAGKAVKGPLVEVMTGLGLEPSSAGIVAAYDGVLDGLAIDRADAASQDQLSVSGLPVLVADTLIAEQEAATRLAAELLTFATAIAGKQATDAE